MKQPLDYIHPICIAPPVSTAAGITFMHPQAPLEVNQYTKEIWALLAECSGRLAATEVIKNSGVKTKLAAMLLKELLAADVLVDCNSLGDAFHAVAMRSHMFPTGLTVHETIHYADEIAVGQKSGRPYKLGKPLATKVGALAAQRKSCRSFSKKPLSLAQLTTLLVTAYSFNVYPVASAAGLYPLRIYVMLARKLGSLQPGYYQFMPHSHAFIHLPIVFDQEIAAYALNSSGLIFGAHAAIFVAGDLAVSSKKYGPRGYQATVLEAGEVVQTVCLTATELGLGSLVFGPDDVPLNALLGLSGREAVLATVAVGHPSLEPTFDSSELEDELTTRLVGPGRPVESVLHLPKLPYNDLLYFRAAKATFAQGAVKDPREAAAERVALGTASSSTFASVKAIAEGVERWAGMQFRTDRQAKARELGAAWIDPRVVAPYDAHQYKKLGLVPFDPSASTQWVEGVNLHSGTPIFAPVDLIFYGPGHTLLNRKMCAWADSSGVAAHMSADQAVRGALLELIERDAIVRNWYARTPPPRLPYKMLPATAQRKIDYWQQQGWAVEVIDLSAHNVAVIGVVIHGPNYPCVNTGFAASDKSFEEALQKGSRRRSLAWLMR